MKTYKHVGTLPIIVDGVEKHPGETFAATLPAEQEAFLLKAGAIQIVEA